MIARAFVVSYFPLFFLSVGLSEIAGNVVLRGLPLVMAGAYVLWRILLTSAALAVGRRSPWTIDRLAMASLAYVGTYSVLYFPRAYGGAVALGTLPSLIVHFLFWHAVFQDRVYVGKPHRFFLDLWIGVASGFATGLTGAMSYTGFSLAAGSIHSLAGRAPFVRSDLDVPMMAVVLALSGGAILTKSRSLAGHMRSALVILPAGAVSMGVSLFALYLYSRRTPMLALMASLGFLVAPRSLSVRFAPLLLAFPFIPVFWDVASQLLLLLTQNSIVDAVVARNDASTYVDATNRLPTWLRSIAFLTDFRPSHLWGYGGAPEAVLPPRLDWQHTHNAFLQVTFDAGLVALTLGLTMITMAFRTLLRLTTGDIRGVEAKILLAVMIAWLVEAGVEPALREYSIIHLLLLLVAATASNLNILTRIHASTSPTVRAA